MRFIGGVINVAKRITMQCGQWNKHSSSLTDMLPYSETFGQEEMSRKDIYTDI